MPLVRIDLMKGKPEGFGKKVGAIVYRAMMETINVPAKDNFLITEHDRNGLIYDASYLDIARTDGVIIIQITLNESEQVQKLEKTLKVVTARPQTSKQIAP